MNPLHLETPLFESQALSRISGRPIWLKLEAVQPPGSFKIRGIGLACREYARRGARRFISSSGGNAGIAVAYAGRKLGVPVVVVVPQTTSDTAKSKILQEDAEVIVHGATWDEANARALSMIGASDAFLHPFDDPLLWQGHSTMVDEVVRAGVRPAVIVLSVGGGGLLSGVVQGLQRHGWNDVPIIAVETRGADSLARSLSAGRRVRLERITSIATTLGALQVCEQAFACARQHPLRSVVVSDRAAVTACRRFVADHRLVTEPACGASLAAVYDGVPEIEGCDSALVIVCGGAGVSMEQLQQWSDDLP
jgi:L-serine/L-threonine ammonia-lyase